MNIQTKGSSKKIKKNKKYYYKYLYGITNVCIFIQQLETTTTQTQNTNTK